MSEVNKNEPDVNAMLEEIKDKLTQLLSKQIPEEDMKLMDALDELQKGYTHGTKNFCDTIMAAVFAMAETQLDREEKKGFGENAIKGIVLMGLNNGFISEAKIEQAQREKLFGATKKIPSC